MPGNLPVLAAPMRVSPRPGTVGMGTGVSGLPFHVAGGLSLNVGIGTGVSGLPFHVAGGRFLNVGIGTGGVIVADLPPIRGVFGARPRPFIPKSGAAGILPGLTVPGPYDDLAPGIPPGAAVPGPYDGLAPGIPPGTAVPGPYEGLAAGKRPTGVLPNPGLTVVRPPLSASLTRVVFILRLIDSDVGHPLPTFLRSGLFHALAGSPLTLV